MPNAADWVQATGHPIVGRGHRPINPRLLAPGMVALPAKAAANAARAKAQRQRRKSIYQTALITTPRTPPQPRFSSHTRAGTKGVPIWRQANDPTAQRKHDSTLQYWHGPR